jgi:predicted RNA binding protein YcfA (HicA-like mRNA interferase family)
MKIPRDLSGSQLAGMLRALGYEIVRQTGSHLRLTSQLGGEHHITIPNHSPLKLGTLAGILSDVGRHFGMTREDVMERILGA